METPLRCWPTWVPVAPAAQVFGAALILLSLSCEPEGPTGQPEETGSAIQFLYPPSDLSVVALDSLRITLTWKDNASGEWGHVVEVRSDPPGFARQTEQAANTDTLTLFIPFDPALSYLFTVHTRRGAVHSASTPPIRVTFEDATVMIVRRYGPTSVLSEHVLRLRNGQEEIIAGPVSGTTHSYNDLFFLADSLVAVGPFTSIGGTDAMHAAVFQGERWRPMGSGIPHFSPSRIAPNNGSIAVGTYYRPNAPAKFFRWTGQEFVTLNPGDATMMGNVVASAVLPPWTLFLFGNGIDNTPPTFLPLFVTAVRTFELFRYWLPSEPVIRDHQRTGIAVVGGVIYVSLVRPLSYLDPAPDTTLVKLDDGRWSIADISGERRHISALTSWNDQVYALLSDLDSNGVMVGGGLATWTGTSWMVIEQMPGGVVGLWTTPEELIIAEAGSQISVRAWNGATWRTLHSLPATDYPDRIVRRRGWTWRS